MRSNTAVISKAWVRLGGLIVGSPSFSLLSCRLHFTFVSLTMIVEPLQTPLTWVGVPFGLGG